VYLAHGSWSKELERQDSGEVLAYKSTRCPQGGWFTCGFGETTTCYKVFTSKASFNNAERNCKSVGGNLAMPQEAGENKCLYSLLNSSKNSFAWIGVKSANTSPLGPYQYVDGSPLTFDDWGLKEPRNHNNFLCVTASRGAHWENNPCKQKYYYVCQVQV